MKAVRGCTLRIDLRPGLADRTIERFWNAFTLFLHERSLGLVGGVTTRGFAGDVIGAVAGSPADLAEADREWIGRWLADRVEVLEHEVGALDEVTSYGRGAKACICPPPCSNHSPECPQFLPPREERP